MAPCRPAGHGGELGRIARTRSTAYSGPAAIRHFWRGTDCPDTTTLRTLREVLCQEHGRRVVPKMDGVQLHPHQVARMDRSRSDAYRFRAVRLCLAALYRPQPDRCLDRRYCWYVDKRSISRARFVETRPKLPSMIVRFPQPFRHCAAEAERPKPDDPSSDLACAAEAVFALPCSPTKRADLCGPPPWFPTICRSLSWPGALPPPHLRAGRRAGSPAWCRHPDRPAR